MTFKKLPKLGDLTIKDPLEKEEENANYTWEMISFSLGWIKDETKDAVEKLISVLDDSCKTQKGACETTKQSLVATQEGNIQTLQIIA